MTQHKTGAASRAGARAELPAYVAVRCPLCGADDYHVRFEDRLDGVAVDPQRHYTSTSSAYGEHGRIVECRSCDLVYMNPRPHHQSVQDNYAAVEDTRYLEEEQGRVETFTESLDHVRQYMPDGHLLDVGCHVGTFLTIAEQAGFQVTGVEPSAWASGIARGRISGPVHRGAVEDAPLPEGGYDAVTLWDVIEHLPDPALDVRLHTRRVRMSYLASRLDAYAPPVARLVGSGLERAGLADRTVGIKLGDIFTVIARKPLET